MKKTLLLMCLTLVLASCTNQPEKEEYGFELGGKTHVTFKFSNVGSPFSMEAFYDQTFPCNEFGRRFDVPCDTTIECDLALNHPAYIVYYSDIFDYTALILPNDTLTIKINAENGKASYEGKNSEASDYMSHVYECPGDEEYKSFEKLKKHYNREQQKLDSVFAKGLLPKWFYNIQTENMYLNIIESFSGFLFRNPDLYDTYRQNLDFSKIKHIWLNNACNVLCTIMDEKYFSLLGPSCKMNVFVQYVQDNIDTIKTKMSEDMVSYFVTSRISLFNDHLSNAKTRADFDEIKGYMDGLIEKNSYLIKDSALLNAILDEQKKVTEEFMAKKTLKPGDVAKNFYLKDINDKSTSLSDFKGKIVLLNFWDTHCIYCIKSIPEKNKLIEDYGKDGFVLMNICLDYNLEGWKQIINEHDAHGTQLICKGNWSDNLRDAYCISARPHYTLVDRKGLVVKNHIPMDSLAIYIEQTIKK